MKKICIAVITLAISCNTFISGIATPKCYAVTDTKIVDSTPVQLFSTGPEGTDVW